MNNTLSIGNVFSGIFALVVFTVGIFNIILVHPVPGTFYLLLSIIYLPQANAYIKNRFGFSIPRIAKLILGIVIIMFTLGVSDLGDMIDKL